MNTINIKNYATAEYFLEPEWVVNIQTPTKAVDEFITILGGHLTLEQGNYSHCLYVRDGGRCRFKSDEGAHGGAEDTVQEVPSAEVIISIPPDEAMLKKALSVINQYHPHEEPTVRITAAFGLRSRYQSGADNPNKYWNRSDSKEIHGTAIE